MTKTWLPLESNPDVMNDYVSKMGLDLSKIQFHDVMSTEEWALEMIPRPVLGAFEFFCSFRVGALSFSRLTFADYQQLSSNIPNFALPAAVILTALSSRHRGLDAFPDKKAD